MTAVRAPLAVLGARPGFAELVPIVRPATSDRVATITAALGAVLASGQVTTGPRGRELEQRVAEFLGVGHVVAVSSCTLGLALAIRAAGLAGREVVLPAYTIAATATAAIWNGCPVRYVDIDAETLTVDLDDLRTKVSDRTGLVVGVHLFGNPCRVPEMEAIAIGAGAAVAFDAAQAFGSTLAGRRVGGFGRFEVFSASPSKHFTMVEGGFVATEDGELAERIRYGRNYGVTADYHVLFPGLNARLSELHAAVGLAVLPDVDTFIKHRNGYAELYRAALAPVPGLGFQRIHPDGVSAYNYFGMTVDAARFGLTHRELARALAAEGVQTKFYYEAPLHREVALGGAADALLPATDRLAGSMVCLPLHNHMDTAVIERIAAIVRDIHQHARAVREALVRTGESKH